jgi:hypothetical protein
MRTLSTHELPIIRSLLRRLSIAVGVTYGFGIVFYLTAFSFASSGTGSPAAENAALTAVGITVVAALVGYVWLAELASRLGRSPIIWAGAALIASPFGLAIAWAMLRGRANEALATGVVQVRG